MNKSGIEVTKDTGGAELSKDQSKNLTKKPPAKLSNKERPRPAAKRRPQSTRPNPRTLNDTHMHQLPTFVPTFQPEQFFPQSPFLPFSLPMWSTNQTVPPITHPVMPQPIIPMPHPMVPLWNNVAQMTHNLPTGITQKANERGTPIVVGRRTKRPKSNSVPCHCDDWNRWNEERAQGKHKQGGKPK